MNTTFSATAYVCCSSIKLAHYTANLVVHNYGKVAAVIGVCYITRRAYKHGVTTTHINFMKSKLVDMVSTFHDSKDLRQAFRSLDFHARRKAVAGHSHGEAAGFRTIADDALRHLVALSGLQDYVISPGQRDANRGLLGDRTYHCAKDLQLTTKVDELPAGNFVFRMVDVDYYVDMPKLLLEEKPVLMYTFAPFEPAGNIPDGVYSSSKDMVTIKINGGADYQHALWDYDHDHIIVKGFWRDVVYLCEHRSIEGDEQHKVVILAPVRSYFNFFGLLTFDGPQMVRRKFSRKGYNLMRFIRKDGGQMESFIALSPDNIVTNCTLPEQLAFNIAQRVLRSKDSILASVEGCLRTYFNGKTINFRWPDWIKTGDPASYATILVDVLENYPDILHYVTNKQTLVATPTMHYVALTDNVPLDTGKTTVRELVSKDIAYFGLATAPKSCESNDIACIKGRITDVKNPDKPVAEKYNGWANDFINEFISGEETHTGFPVDPEEVSIRQSRPSQRRIIGRCINWLWDRKTHTVVSSFQKRETYSKYVSPRNISTLPGTNKVRFSQFTYAIGPAFYKHKFYAFSKTPKQLEERMEEFLREAIETAPPGRGPTVVPTDFSKFDGTHSKWLMEVEIRLFKRFFAPEFHDELEDLMRSNFQATGYTRHGVKYDTDFTRLSGCSDTSLCNTFDAALVAYLSWRRQGMTHSEAWLRLGIYGGDDGVTANITPSIYKAMCDTLGLKIKITEIRSGEPVPFLGREFCGHWGGPMWSMCDIKRQAAKLHCTTATSDTPDWIVMLRKATGLLTTDRHTPLVGAWATAVEKYCKSHGIRLGGDESLSERLFERYTDPKDQFNSCNDGTEYVYAEINTGLRAEAIQAEEARLAGLGPDATVESFFRRLLEETPPVEIPVTAGAFVLDPQPAPTPDDVGKAGGKQRTLVVTGNAGEASADHHERRDEKDGPAGSNSTTSSDTPPRINRNGKRSGQHVNTRPGSPLEHPVDTQSLSPPPSTKSSNPDGPNPSAGRKRRGGQRRKVDAPAPAGDVQHH